MDNLELLPEDDVKNKLKYELHLSKHPDEQLIRRYEEHVVSLIKADKDETHGTTTTPGTEVVLKLKKHTHQKLLYGSIRFNQNIEDEWLIIYLLFKLSLYDPDLVIRVHDSDGDILLIEAAEHLPNWLESSRSKNRAFIHRGHLHIIPENINLKELHSNYESRSSSSSIGEATSPPSTSPAAAVTITQVAAQFIREMNDGLGRSIRDSALNNYNQNGDSEACDSSGSGSSGDNHGYYFENLKKVDTLANSAIQNAINEQLSGMPDKKAWLSRKFKQLDEIISDKVVDDAKSLNKKFRESLSLASVMAMEDDDLRISPISSAPSSVASSLSAASSSSSSSWMSEQQND